MGTLVDELIADLDEDVPEEDLEEGEDGAGAMEDEEGEIENVDERLLESLKGNDIHKVATLLSSSRFKSLLSRVEAQPPERESKEVVGIIEEDPEYKLIVESNSVVADINNEIQLIHKYIRDNYAAKFPELESLVVNPLDYARVVQRIANHTDLTILDLTDILPAATIMVVSVAASTSSGKVLDNEILKRVLDACSMILQLDDARTKLLAFVESRMTFIAPNLSALVGSSVAARLIAAAGGLKSLAKIPACNVMLLGAPKRILGGFSSTHSRRCTNGFINECELVKKSPLSLQLKVLRLISTKLVLAIRVDAEHSYPDGGEGRKLYDIIVQKIEKMQEAPPPKLAKPLPAPDDRPKKRRAGARARKLKEKYAVTDLRKHANRMSFGVAEEEVSSSGTALGMIGVAGSGKIRLSAQEKNLFKKQKLQAQQQQKKGIATPGFATSGLATSLAFTPVVGLELVSPQAQQAKIDEANRALNNKYFSQGSFFQVKKQKTED